MPPRCTRHGGPSDDSYQPLKWVGRGELRCKQRGPAVDSRHAAGALSAERYYHPLLSPRCPREPLDSSRVYWAAHALVLARAMSGGTIDTLASGGDLVLGIAVDGTSVYFTTAYNNGVPGEVLKAPLQGGPAVTLASRQQNVGGIAVDATSVYWINQIGPNGSVMKLTPK